MTRSTYRPWRDRASGSATSDCGRHRAVRVSSGLPVGSMRPCWPSPFLAPVRGWTGWGRMPGHPTSGGGGEQFDIVKRSGSGADRSRGRLCPLVSTADCCLLRLLPNHRPPNVANCVCVAYVWTERQRVRCRCNDGRALPPPQHSSPPGTSVVAFSGSTIRHVFCIEGDRRWFPRMSSTPSF